MVEMFGGNWRGRNGIQSTHRRSWKKNSTDVNKEIFNVDVSKYVNCQNRLRANLGSDFTLILGQCTKLTHMQLEVLLTWEAVDDRSNVIKLLKMLKILSHQTTDQKYHPLSLCMSKRSVCRLQQGPHVTNAQLVDKLKERVEVVEEIG